MPAYDRSTTVAADPDRAFAFLSNPGNLPRYVATMVMARPEGGDHLHVAADVQGRHEEGEAMFRSEAARHRLEWGAGDASGYRGSLDVSPDANGSMVHLHLNVPHAHDEGEIGRALDETMQNIDRLLGSA